MNSFFYCPGGRIVARNPDTCSMMPRIRTFSETAMPILTLRATLRLVDSLATTFAQAYQLARVRLASAASPVLRMMVQRDEAVRDTALLQRELAILRSQREQIAPPAGIHARTTFGYSPTQADAGLDFGRDVLALCRS